MGKPTAKSFCEEKGMPVLVAGEAKEIYGVAARKLSDMYVNKTQRYRLKAASLYVAAISVGNLKKFDGNQLGVAYKDADSCAVSITDVGKHFDVKFNTLRKAIDDVVSYTGMAKAFYGDEEYRGVRNGRKASPSSG